MKHFLLIKSNAISPSGAKMNPEASAKALLQSGMWPLWEFTRNRKAITVGDLIAVYVTGNSRVIASAKVEKISEWSPAFAKKYPLALDGIPFSVLELGEINLLKKPVMIKERIEKLSFVNHLSKKWGVAFLGGTRSINPIDYRIMTEGQ